MIDLTKDSKGLEHNIQKARENNVIIPTFAQMQNPEFIPEKIKDKLKDVGLWDINPLNLFRISWRNEQKVSGGGFGKPNFIELPKSLTGIDAKIVCMVGKWFPTGCHKVGASFGCLAPRLVTGQFDSTVHKAVWPSTGNYCRGGAFNSKLLAADSVAILPQGMSRERFEWLEQIAGEIIATPGTESNVKEIFDETWNIRKNRKDCIIFNQFEEMGNYMWHYNVTARAIADAFECVKTPNGRLAGMCFTSGSAGTMASGDYIKQIHPNAKLAVGEALQCPTILNNGFGDHRVEGIGDKHIPWVHNIKNTDMAIAIDDNDSMALLRLFNEPEGEKYLMECGVPEATIKDLKYMGISGTTNLLCAVKFAKYYELTADDVVFTVLTDSVEMYGSRLEEMREEQGGYTQKNAIADFAACLLAQRTDNVLELTYPERKRIHNLKYYTWVEQQGRTAAELNEQWYGTLWTDIQKQSKEVDSLIDEFNDRVGLLAKI